MPHENAKPSTAADFARRFFAAEIRAFRGEQPLAKVFWGYGVAVSALIAAVYALALYAGHIAVQQILLPCAAAYSAWILVAVWRCARNAQQRFWGLLARLLTIAWAGNVTLVLLFLQLDLIATYLGH